MTDTMTTSRSSTDLPTTGQRTFAVLVGLTTLAISLQGVWAGIFLEHDGARDASSGWIDMHARGADVAIVLAIVGIWKLRERRDLWLGSLALTVLLILESSLGGLIRDGGKDTLTAVHVPLAMGIMALVVWLPLRLRRRTA